MEGTLDLTDNGNRDFNAAAATWDDNPMRVELARAVADAMLSRVSNAKDMHVMDYGAGTGLVTLAFQPCVHSITAADSSEGMLARLNEKVAASGLTNVQTTLLDLESDTAPEQRFDLIVSSMTMHHIKDVPALIRSFQEMLHAGGYLAIADLDLDDGEFHPDPTGVWHNGFSRDEMNQIFVDSDFGDVTIETAHTLTKQVPGKGGCEFSVFLIVGRKD